jgi:hypothetical protein
MKELAIYGCSFASNDAPHGWSHLLQQTDLDNIDIFAERGSSLDWNFNNFLNTQVNYKNIVFVVTTIGRIHFPIECTHKRDKTVKVFEHWSGIDSIQWTLENYTSKNNLLENLFKFSVEFGAHQHKYTKNTQSAIINYIKFLRPDAIIIPAFRQASVGDIPDLSLDLEYTNWSLYDISCHETSGFDNNIIWNQDPRCNHLTKISNKWFLKHVQARLAGEFIGWDKTQTPSFSSIENLKNAC